MNRKSNQSEPKVIALSAQESRNSLQRKLMWLSAAAILLGALLIVGLKPGPEMLTTELSTTFSMVWSIAIANIFATILLIAGARHVAKIAFVPGHLVVPAMVFNFLY